MTTVYFIVNTWSAVFDREQRQKETTKTAVVNSFPKDRDYRREAMQAAAVPSFGASKCVTVTLHTLVFF